MSDDKLINKSIFNEYNDYLDPQKLLNKLINENLKLDGTTNTSYSTKQLSSSGDSESFKIRMKEIEAADKDKERNTPKIVRYFGTGDTLKAVIIWSIAMLLALALLIAMVSKNTEMVKAIIPALSTTVGFLVGSRA
ncbi:MAG: hypothetical protein VB076_03600 [Synergistaceae bacterium]|nr:hypothetical protein [Synergistaceae bacterium]